MFFLLKSLPSVFELLNHCVNIMNRFKAQGYQQQYSKKSSHFKVKQNKETQIPDLTELVSHPISTKNLEQTPGISVPLLMMTQHFHGSWDLDSGLHVCKASSLTHDPSLQFPRKSTSCQDILRASCIKLTDQWTEQAEMPI